MKYSDVKWYLKHGQEVAEDVTKGDAPTSPETQQGYWTNVVTGVTKERI